MDPKREILPLLAKGKIINFDSEFSVGGKDTSILLTMWILVLKILG